MGLCGSSESGGDGSNPQQQQQQQQASSQKNVNGSTEGSGQSTTENTTGTTTTGTAAAGAGAAGGAVAVGIESSTTSVAPISVRHIDTITDDQGSPISITEEEFRLLSKNTLILLLDRLVTVVKFEKDKCESIHKYLINPNNQPAQPAQPSSPHNIPAHNSSASTSSTSTQGVTITIQSKEETQAQLANNNNSHTTNHNRHTASSSPPSPLTPIPSNSPHYVSTLLCAEQVESYIISHFLLPVAFTQTYMQLALPSRFYSTVQTAKEAALNQCNTDSLINSTQLLCQEIQARLILAIYACDQLNKAANTNTNSNTTPSSTSSTSSTTTTASFDGLKEHFQFFHRCFDFVKGDLKTHPAYIIKNIDEIVERK
jgi:hypothetical protein